MWVSFQIEALTEELESLRNQRVVLRNELQEAAATVRLHHINNVTWAAHYTSLTLCTVPQSKTYQDLLHVMKEELKQQQKESAELMERSAARESQLQQQVSAVREQPHTLQVRDLTPHLFFCFLSDESDEWRTLSSTRPAKHRHPEPPVKPQLAYEREGWAPRHAEEEQRGGRAAETGSTEEWGHGKLVNNICGAAYSHFSSHWSHPGKILITYQLCC